MFCVDDFQGHLKKSLHESVLHSVTQVVAWILLLQTAKQKPLFCPDDVVPHSDLETGKGKHSDFRVMQGLPLCLEKLRHLLRWVLEINIFKLKWKKSILGKKLSCLSIVFSDPFENFYNTTTFIEYLIVMWNTQDSWRKE